jgi:outer membrane protein TolC
MRKKYRRTFRRGAALALALQLGVASRSAAAPLTLPDAVRQALATSPAVLESRAREEAAAQGRREAGAARWPTFEARELAVRTDSPADVFGLQLMQERFSLADFAASDPNSPEPFDNFATEVEARWPIFTGGRLRAGVRQAGAMLDGAEAQAAHTRAAVALAVTSAYMDVLLAERGVDLAKRTRDSVARHVKQAEDFFEAGMIVESDLLQAQVQLAGMEEAVITATNREHLARAGLNRAMGVPQDREQELTPEPPPLASVDVPLDSMLARATERRRDLQAVRARTRAADAGVSLAKGELYPEIGVAVRYSLNDDVPFGAHGESWALVAAARWKFWDWGGTWARTGRFRAERAAAEQSARAYEHQVAFEVRQAWLAVGEARARHEVAARAATTAERAAAILQDRFTNEVARITDLLDAETLLHEARVRELQSRFDLQRATRTLEFATGGSPVPEVTP